MVKGLRHLFLLALLTLSLLVPLVSQALLPQTRADLDVLRDRLQYEFFDRDKAINPGAESLLPILVAPPQAYWQESQSDFGSAVMESLREVFKAPGSLVNCAECYQSRVYVANDGRSIIQNGPLSLSDLARLRSHPAYRQAKSILTIRETPEGVSVQVLSLDDARILYSGLADARQTLNDAEPPLRLAREFERRQRGEALGYINVDLGLLMDGKFQFKFLEQWGDRNQHLSGLALSLYNPNLSLGGTYLYMLPAQRRLTLGLSAYYSLAALLQANSEANRLTSNLVGEVSVNYALSGSYGIFISASSEGKLAAGFSLLNPVLFPFLL